MSGRAVLEERRRALFARASDAVLIETIEKLEAVRPSFGSDERMALAWVCDELEQRHPGVEAAMDAWVEEHDDRPYGLVLLAALAELGVTR